MVWSWPSRSQPAWVAFDRKVLRFNCFFFKEAVNESRIENFRVRRCVPFEAARFAGYAHRRTLGDDHAGDAKTAERKSKTYAFGVAGDEPEPTEKERKGSKGIQKQRRGPNVKKSRDDERFLKRMRGGR